MRQLTGLDVQFLALETPRQSGHVSGLAVLDPGTTPTERFELGHVQRLIEERLPLLPPFRWRLKEVPLGLDYPYWIDDPDFDLEHQVRELALPPPPTDAKLAEQVARSFSRPLDRSRPLWELYLIHGLQGGQVALLTKIHHAVVDGLSGAEILGVLLDLSPEGSEPPQRPTIARTASRAIWRCSPATCSGRHATPNACSAGCRRRCPTSRTRRSRVSSRAPRRSAPRQLA